MPVLELHAVKFTDKIVPQPFPVFQGEMFRVFLCRTDFNADHVLARRRMGFYHVPYALRIESARKQVVFDVVYQFGMFLVPRLSGDVSEGVYSVTYGFCLAYHVFSFVSVCSCILGLSGIRFGAKWRSMIFVMDSAVLPSSCSAPTIQV